MNSILSIFLSLYMLYLDFSWQSIKKACKCNELLCKFKYINRDFAIANYMLLI